MVDEVQEFDETKKYICDECGVQEATAKCVGGQRSRDVDTETTLFICGACGVTVERYDEVTREVTMTVV